MNDLVLIGAGGFAREVLWLVEENNKVKREWNILGLIDKSDDKIRKVYGYEIIGNDEWLINYPKELNVLCCVAEPGLRRNIIANISVNKNLLFPSIISYDARISEKSNLGQGCIVCAGSIVTVDVTIGNFVLVNVHSTIGHDVAVDDFCTINAHCDITGGVRLEEDVFLGSHVTVIPQKKIGTGAYIGAGSVVMTNIRPGSKVMGNPARKIDF